MFQAQGGSVHFSTKRQSFVSRRDLGRVKDGINIGCRKVKRMRRGAVR